MTDTPARVNEALAWLERRGSKRAREQMLTRYGITAPRSFGVSMAMIQQLAKKLGRDHRLAAALWASKWYEARLLAAFVDEPERVTSAQMDRWTRDFDNWGVCDTVCFKLFDRTPHAWSKVAPWCKHEGEFVRRAGFALLASLALHDKAAPETAFLRTLPLVERASTDQRNFVKKGVSWALRSIGGRSPSLNAAAIELATRLAASADPSSRWLGRDALRGLTAPATRRRVAAVAGRKKQA